MKQRMHEEQLRQKEQELQEREIDLLQRELHFMIKQQTPTPIKRKGKRKIFTGVLLTSFLFREI